MKIYKIYSYWQDTGTLTIVCTGDPKSARYYKLDYIRRYRILGALERSGYRVMALASGWVARP